MDLKQKAANAWEAKSSREGAVATAKQGNVSGWWIFSISAKEHNW